MIEHRQQHPNPHVLLVEDNQDDYEATVRSLKKNSVVCPVHWCRDGRDALEYLRKNGAHANDADTRRPSLILLDLNMPGIDGRQVLEDIKRDVNLKMIPVVILTTSSDSKDVEQCYDLGASTYIQKPVNYDDLTEIIRTMKDYWFGIALLPCSADRKGKA